MEVLAGAHRCARKQVMRSICRILQVFLILLKEERSERLCGAVAILLVSLASEQHGLGLLGEHRRAGAIALHIEATCADQEECRRVPQGCRHLGAGGSEHSGLTAGDHLQPALFKNRTRQRCILGCGCMSHSLSRKQRREPTCCDTVLFSIYGTIATELNRSTMVSKSRMPAVHRLRVRLFESLKKQAPPATLFEEQRGVR